MKVIRTSIENLEAKKQLLYKLTKSSGTSVKDIDGTFPVKAWALYEDTNTKGETNEVLSIISEGGLKLQTISDTFTRAFFDCVECMGTDEFSIIIVHGKTKSGREYVTCELDCGEI